MALQLRANTEERAMSTRASLLGLGVSVLVAGSGFAQVTQRVSLTWRGLQANGGSRDATVSADGRHVAFRSDASNLVRNDTNGIADVFVRDLLTGMTERVSVASGGTQSNGGSTFPSISADGRFVAFGSDATNLVAGDTNVTLDVFVRDRLAGTTERVSVGSSGIEANDRSLLPSISADGRYVVFGSSASNLVAGDTNGAPDIFIRDRQAGTTERVGVGSGGEEPDFGAAYGRISADGRYVAFWSFATNLVSGDTNGFWDVFVLDLQTGTIERVSVDSLEQEGDEDSIDASISSDGRFVVFQSQASNLVAGDTNGNRDVFVRDRSNGTTQRVSVDSAGAQAIGTSWGGRISQDGRWVSFFSYSPDLVAGDTNGFPDIFVRDLQGGTTERVSLTSWGGQTNGYSESPTISGDGRFVTFLSAGSNLVAGDTNGLEDIFLRDRDATSFTSLCHPGIDGVISCPCGQPANPVGGCANHGAGATSGAMLSASGVAYLSADTLVLTTSNHRAPAIGVLNVFFSYKPGGTTPTMGSASGAGVSCIGSGGDLGRLYTMQVFGGTGSKPGMGDLSVSARSATWPAHAISPGETRYYFNVYRDGQAGQVANCNNAGITTNLTNMGSITWSP